MVALTLALCSSLLWGIADYLGGLRCRSFPVPVVLALMYLASLTVMAVFVVARDDGPPGAQSVVAGLCAGLVGIAALAAFYQALAIGTMSIVAPIASTGVALPVIVGVVGGEHPEPMRAIGIAAAVVGVVLASREVPSDVDARPGGAADADVRDAGGHAGRDLEGGGHAGGDLDPRGQRRSILLALVAGLGFGTYFVAAEIASRGDVAWALLLSRVAAAPVAVAVAVVLVHRGGRRPRGRGLLAVAGIGLLDLAANTAYSQATRLGDLSVVSVASSLYPVATMMLAAVLLGERVRGMQRAGVLVALAGVLLIAAGGR